MLKKKESIMPKRKVSPAVSAYFAEIGSEGGKIGGKVTASRMTPEQRQERARKAGMAPKKSRKISVDTETNAG